LLGLKCKCCVFDFVAVLSDANKRLMYDVGVYDSDDDENVSHEFHTCSYTSWDPPLLAFFYYPKLLLVLCLV
jgi:hypothetical protein